MKLRNVLLLTAISAMLVACGGGSSVQSQQDSSKEQESASSSSLLPSSQNSQPSSSSQQASSSSEQPSSSSQAASSSSKSLADWPREQVNYNFTTWEVPEDLLPAFQHEKISSYVVSMSTDAVMRIQCVGLPYDEGLAAFSTYLSEKLTGFSEMPIISGNPCYVESNRYFHVSYDIGAASCFELVVTIWIEPAEWPATFIQQAFDYWAITDYTVPAFSNENIYKFQPEMNAQNDTLRIHCIGLSYQDGLTAFEKYAEDNLQGFTYQASGMNRSYVEPANRFKVIASSHNNQGKLFTFIIAKIAN